MYIHHYLLQYFESDNPELYTTKIQYIKENDVTDLGLVFAEEEFDITNGGRPTVSERGKRKDGRYLCYR
jgi:hypothetical protein